MQISAKPVLVVWRDSTHWAGWQPMRGLKRRSMTSIPVIRTVGFVVRRTKRYIVVAASLNCEDDLAGDLMVIPTEQIAEIRELE